MSDVTANQRAKLMLEVAAKFIEKHCPEGKIHYDEADCDGFCVAEDCRIAADMIDMEEEAD